MKQLTLGRVGGVQSSVLQQRLKVPPLRSEPVNLSKHPSETTRDILYSFNDSCTQALPTKLNSEGRSDAPSDDDWSVKSSMLIDTANYGSPSGIEIRDIPSDSIKNIQLNAKQNNSYKVVPTKEHQNNHYQFVPTMTRFRPYTPSDMVMAGSNASDIPYVIRDDTRINSDIRDDTRKHVMMNSIKSNDTTTLVVSSDSFVRNAIPTKELTPEHHAAVSSVIVNPLK